MSELRARAPAFLLMLWLAGVALALGLRAGDVGVDQLRMPFSLGPAESSNLETIKVIRSGGNPYGAEIYAQPPFVFTGYTPLYHYVVASLPMPDENPFLYGRIVAAGAMLLAGLLPFLVPGRAGFAVAGIATLVFFGLAPVAQRTVFLRNDSLALLLAGLAVLAAQRASRHSAWALAAAALAVLAVFTKQSFVSAPIACAVYLFIADRKGFRWYAASGSCFAAGAVGFVHTQWGSGFWFCTIRAPQHPMALVQALLVTKAMLREPLFLALVGSSLGLMVLEWRRVGKRLFSDSPYPIYVVVSTLALVATVGKLGSGTNYFVEPILALLLWDTHALREPGRRDPRGRTRMALAGVIGVAGALQLAITDRPVYRLAEPLAAEQRRREIASVREDVESLGFEDPTVLGVVRHPGLYRESDRVQLSFPLFYVWLWSERLLDVRTLVESVEKRQFDVIVVPTGIARGRGRLSAPRSAVVDAVLANYRVGLEGSGQRYYVRPSAAPEPAVSP